MKKKLLKKIRSRCSDIKFMTVAIGSMIVIILVLVIVYICISTNTAKKEFRNTAGEAMSNVRSNLETYFDSMVNAADAVFNNDVLQAALRNTDNHNNDLKEYRQLENLIYGMENNHSFHISVYVNDDKLYAGEMVHFYPISEARNENGYEDIIKKNGKVCWIENSSKKMYETGESEDTLACARVIKNKEDFTETIGIVKIDIPKKIVESIIDSMAFVGTSERFLINSYGKIFLSSNDDILDTNRFDDKDLQKMFSDDLGMLEHKEASVNNMAVYCRMEKQNWCLAVDMLAKEVSGYRTSLYFTSLLIILLLCMVGLSAILIHFMYSRIINNKIREVVNKIENNAIDKIAAGNSDNRDNLGRLEKSVDEMIARINEVMKAYYEVQIREQEALMSALQAQVNPHFLYNTLDVINWVAIENDNREISSMVSMLAKYFRLSLGMGKNIVHIKSELELIQVYMKIQEFRFKNNIDAHYDIEDGLNDYLIPKMTLQPIIENALIHGICKNNVSNGVIDIKIRKNEEKIIISIRDDGKGTDADMLNKCILYGNTERNPHTSSGYGLHNVYERIVLFSDGEEGCGITASSSSAGTEIVITMKAKYQK